MYENHPGQLQEDGQTVPVTSEVVRNLVSRLGPYIRCYGSTTGKEYNAEGCKIWGAKEGRRIFSHDVYKKLV